MEREPKIDLDAVAIKAQYEVIKQVLNKNLGNRTKTAEQLNINRKTLYNKIAAYNKLKNGEKEKSN